MILADYGFLEYSFNPNVTDIDQVNNSLTSLGFTQRAIHVSNNVSVWIQNFCILLVRETSTVTHPGVTGIGLMVNDNHINTLNATFDSEISMFVTGDTKGTRIILCSNTQSSMDFFDSNYIVTNYDSVRDAGIKQITGITITCADARQLDFYQEMGFKFTKSGKQYNTFVSSNNQFSILFDKQSTDNGVMNIILDTNDIFYSTSFLSSKGVEFMHYANIDAGNIPSMAHKIKGYNCVAAGNDKSYSIENFAHEALPFTDLILRSRKQYMHTTEDIISRHYD